MENEIKTVLKKTKLSREDKKNIQLSYSNMELNQLELAEKYNVPQSNISRIINGKTQYIKKKTRSPKQIEPEKRKQFIETATKAFKAVDKDPFERAKMIAEDASTIVELGMTIAKYELQKYVAKLENGENAVTESINLDKITKLLSVIAPYVIEKKSDPLKGKKDTPKAKMSTFMTQLKKAQ